MIASELSQFNEFRLMTVQNNCLASGVFIVHVWVSGRVGRFSLQDPRHQSQGHVSTESH